MSDLTKAWGRMGKPIAEMGQFCLGSHNIPAEEYEERINVYLEQIAAEMRNLLREVVTQTSYCFECQGEGGLYTEELLEEIKGLGVNASSKGPAEPVAHDHS